MGDGGWGGVGWGDTHSGRHFWCRAVPAAQRRPQTGPWSQLVCGVSQPWATLFTHTPPPCPFICTMYPVSQDIRYNKILLPYHPQVPPRAQVAAAAGAGRPAAVGRGLRGAPGGGERPRYERAVLCRGEASGGRGPVSPLCSRLAGQPLPSGGTAASVPRPAPLNVPWAPFKRAGSWQEHGHFSKGCCRRAGQGDSGANYKCCIFQ